MVKIKIISTNEIREVTPNVAHDLIDRGIAELLQYETRVMTPRNTYSSKPRKHRPDTYRTRQMRSGNGRRKK